jgi:Icc protein
MAWFEHQYTFTRPQLTFAHITDCHLSKDSDGQYFDVNTAQYLQRVLAYLSQHKVDGIIFGGDLTQDHSRGSYQLFAQLIESAELSCPVFWVPGNHDELELLEAMNSTQIQEAKVIHTPKLSLLLSNSKGPTPAGWCREAHLRELKDKLHELDHCALVFCHHHPLPINGYLDKHILENGTQLLNVLVESNKVAAVFHGHVHNEYQQKFRELDVFSTPATSIQFVKHTNEWLQQDLGPGFRLIHINEDAFNTEVVWLNG